MVRLQIRLAGKRTYSPSVTRKLQMENDAGRDAKIVLRFAVRCGFREARQKIFNLCGSPRQTVKELPINRAEGGGESVAGRLWFANTSAEAQVAAVLGRAGLNTIIASIQHEDSGGQEPECA
jgi:hypothetical protein